MAELFTNLARSTLASGIAAGGLSLTVQSGDGNLLFPADSVGDSFNCLLFKKATGDVEIITCTSRSADVLTIVRKTEEIGNITPAVAYAFDAGDIVELRPGAAFYTALAAGASSTNIQQGTFLYGVDTGAPDAYQVAMSPTASALATGQEVRVKIKALGTNTGACTLQLDATGLKAIKLEDGTDPAAGMIVADFTHTFQYDGTNYVLQSSGLALTADGFNAAAKQIKNVAAGTDATDAATIGGTETLVAKTLTDPVIECNSGELTIETLPVYGMVVLDTPESLSTATTTGSWVSSSGFASTTLSTAGATKAIIRIVVNDGLTGTQDEVRAHLRKAGTALSPNDTTSIAETIQDASASTALGVVCSGEGIVNLDGSSDFEYFIFASSGTASFVTVTLVGYYI